MIQQVQAIPIPQELPVIPKGDLILYSELMRHTEVIDSLLRVLIKLREAPDTDPLLDVKINQGEQLLSKVDNATKRIAPRIIEYPDLVKIQGELIEKLKNAQTMIDELSPILANELYCRYLAQIMYFRINVKEYRTRKYGITRMHQVNSIFVKLSDWVEGAETRENNNRIEENNIVPNTQTQFREIQPCEEGIKKFREDLRKCS